MKKISIAKMESISGGLAVPCIWYGLGLPLIIVVPGASWYFYDDLVKCWNS